MKGLCSVLAASWMIAVSSGIASAQTPPDKPADAPKAAAIAPKASPAAEVPKGPADKPIEQPAYRSPGMRTAGAVLTVIGISAGLAGASVSFAEAGHAFDRDPEVKSPYPIMAAALFGACGAFLVAGIPLWALGAREPQKGATTGSLTVQAGPGRGSLRFTF